MSADDLRQLVATIGDAEPELLQQLSYAALEARLEDFLEALRNEACQLRNSRRDPDT